MHIHHLQTETIRVERGRIGYAIAGEAPTRSPAPASRSRSSRASSTASGTPARTTLADRRGLPGPTTSSTSSRQVYASVAAHGGRPGAFDGAYLLTRYRSEFAMTAIPAPVRRFVLPLQALLGRAFGRYGHFADAPTPVSRPTSATLPGRTTSARSSAG